MNADRLNAWIYKLCPGGVRLQLVFDQALVSGTVINSWPREDVDAAREAPIPGQTIGDQLIEAAQEHADNLGESCKFSIVWAGRDGQPLRTMHHRAGPSGGTANEYAAQAGNVTGNALTGQLLTHIHQQQKVLNGSIGIILTAYERTLTMQQVMIEKLASRLDAMPLPSPDTDSEAVQAAKLRALEKVVDLGPDVARLAIATVAKHLGVGSGDQPTPPPAAPNGHVS